MNLPPKLFIDTSFFIALLNNSDNDHNRAIQLQTQLTLQKTEKITSEYVLLELADGLSRLRFRHLVTKLIDLIYQDKSFMVIPTTSKYFKTSYHLFKNRQDKEWGLTDCTSFTIMQELKLDSALTADHHFVQAGFRALLLELE